MVSVISGQDLVFRYGHREVLHSISFSVESGVCGLLGPNGAGKSTLMEVLATQRAANSGTVFVSGHDLSTSEGRMEARKCLGVLPQHYSLVGAMTAADTVAYAAWTHGVPTARMYDAGLVALERVGATDLARRRVRSLSGGQRQRVGIACALAHEPAILILDEPTVGLDPHARVLLRRTLREVSEHCSILLSSHMIEDVAQLCSKVIVLNQGQIVFDGSRESLQTAGAGMESDLELASPLERGYEAVLSVMHT